VTSVPSTVVPVLGYHSIGDERRDGTLRWSVSPGDFDEQMALLKDRRCTSLTVSAYAATLRGTAPLPERPVVITFDDGFADLAGTALPVLRRHGLTATAYLITAHIGVPPSRDTDLALGWDEVAELRANGIEIGSHGHTHRALDCLRRADVRTEVAVSKLLLEQRLGEPVSSFAYPYGYSSAAARSEVRAAGYTCACGVKNALSHERDDLFSIARVLMRRDMTLETLDALVAGAGAPLAWRGERLRTWGWRLARRAQRLVDGARSGRSRNEVGSSAPSAGGGEQ